MWCKNLLLLILSLTIFGQSWLQKTSPFKILYKWKHLELEFPSKLQLEQYLSNGQYVPENQIPMGVEVKGSRVWISLGKWRDGVPATLVTVSRNSTDLSPKVKPYPNWEFYKQPGNCSSLTNVFRIKLDSCGRLWALDNGVKFSEPDYEIVCPPSLVVFDLKTDKPIGRYPIPKEYVLPESIFTNLVIDTHSEVCEDLHIYLVDVVRLGLIVFREKDKQYWKFTHEYFYPDPLACNYTVHGVNFQYTDGIFGLALSNQAIDKTYSINADSEDKILYFHPLSSYRLFWTRTSVLKDPQRVDDSEAEFRLIGESRGLLGQSVVSVIDRRGVMFYSLVSRDSIGCWDTRKPYFRKNLGVVAEDDNTLVFPTEVIVDEDDDQNVWVVSNKLPIFSAGKINPNKYNYHILYANAHNAVQSTICD